MRNAGSVVTREQLIDEVWDANWFGSTKTLDVHVSGLRKKLGDDSARAALPAHGAGRRVPVLVARGAGRESHEPAPPAARRFAYVLLLIIVALEVPLALNLARRVDAEVKNEAASQALVVAAGASGSMARPANLQGLAQTPGATSARASSSSTAAASSGPTRRGRSCFGTRTRAATRSRPALSGLRAQGERHSDELGADILYTAVPVVKRTSRPSAPSG